MTVLGVKTSRLTTLGAAVTREIGCSASTVKQYVLASLIGLWRPAAQAHR
jgi:phosphoglycerate dehydrogenase-like enzyme